jgi:hypothetical protein
MLKKNFVKALGIAMLLVSAQAPAMTLDWSGGYRFEYTEVDKPSLGSPSERKAYGLNYLYLSPKIIAADGVNVTSRFDILSSAQYPGSQLGTIWGFDGNTGGATTPSATNNNQGAAQVTISQLYLTVNQEYGALIVGRAPLDFGLGMSYNSGKGAFDHWYDTRDVVAYKIVFGDWFLMPLLSRQASVYEFGQGGSISSTAAVLQYENADNRSLLGVIMEQKKGAKEALGYSPGQVAAYGGTGATVGSNLSTTATHFVLGRGFDSFAFKIEAGFVSGETGVTTALNEDVTLNGYGIAAELSFPRPESKWNYSVKMGMATGDDEGASFGGYAFDQNYDVAMLMFNHRLGKRDLLKTNVYRTGTDVADPTAMQDVGNSADDEYLSNAVYLAPSVNYLWSERLEVRNTLVWAQLANVVNSSVDSSKDLGLEWDIEVIYKPSDRIQWVNQVGLLFPGGAYKNGTEGLENGFNYGFASKAAISF